ncbi:hypothetical protein GGR56DRAFT_629380 [Xylariaceae sp. FL0804]|nr:hypothetical protein GGR56DRAFT_629380 [Xylariaceae sp. FL0804]
MRYYLFVFPSIYLSPSTCAVRYGMRRDRRRGGEMLAGVSEQRRSPLPLSDTAENPPSPGGADVTHLLPASLTNSLPGSQPARSPPLMSGRVPRGGQGEMGGGDGTDT